MKKILVLLLTLSCVALHGRCACNKPKPTTPNNPQVQAPTKKECSTCPLMSKKQEATPAAPATK